MIIAAGLSKFLWAEAKHHMVWLHNCTPTSLLPGNTILYQMAKGRKPDLFRVCEWGKNIYVKLQKAGKLESKVEEAKFVGINNQSKRYRIYWPGKSIVTVERDVYFSREAALMPDNVQIEEEWRSSNLNSLPFLKSALAQTQAIKTEPVDNMPSTPTQVKPSKDATETDEKLTKNIPTSKN